MNHKQDVDPLDEKWSVLDTKYKEFRALIYSYNPTDSNLVTFFTQSYKNFLNELDTLGADYHRAKVNKANILSEGFEDNQIVKELIKEITADTNYWIPLMNGGRDLKLEILEVLIKVLKKKKN